MYSNPMDDVMHEFVSLFLFLCQSKYVLFISKYSLVSVELAFH